MIGRLLAVAALHSANWLLAPRRAIATAQTTVLPAPSLVWMDGWVESTCPDFIPPDLLAENAEWIWPFGGFEGEEQ